MRPGGEGPGGVADEIGAVVRDAEVVDHLPRAGVVYLTEGDTVTQQREQPIPGLETARRPRPYTMILTSFLPVALHPESAQQVSNGEGLEHGAGDKRNNRPESNARRE
ncbi:MAG: hypothetical protein N3E46_13520, partial [Gemmataceae bacterium]|nr:hypothetical protein [Gemmataceae bacterium]